MALPWTSYPSGTAILIRRFLKFCIVGASGIAVNTSVFWLLISRFQLHYLLASPVAAEVAICSNYLLNNNWTFVDRRTRFVSLPGLAQYHAVSLGGIAVNLIVLHILAGSMGVHPMIANLAGIALATGWNFALNLLWTWRRPRRASAPMIAEP